MDLQKLSVKFNQNLSVKCSNYHNLLLWYFYIFLSGHKESLLELDITLSYMSDDSGILFELLYNLSPRTILHLSLDNLDLDKIVLERISYVNCTLNLVSAGLKSQDARPLRAPIRRGEVEVSCPLSYATDARHSFHQSELQLFRILRNCKEFVFWNMWATRKVFEAIAEIGTWAKLDQVKIVKQEQQLTDGITMKWNDWFGSEDFEKLLGVCLLQIVVTIED